MQATHQQDVSRKRKQTDRKHNECTGVFSEFSVAKKPCAMPQLYPTAPQMMAPQMMAPQMMSAGMMSTGMMSAGMMANPFMYSTMPYMQMATPMPNVLQTHPATMLPQAQWIGVRPIANPSNTAELDEEQMEYIRSDRRERDRDIRKKMREEDPQSHLDRLAARREREREVRRKERETGAATREDRLERRRLRERGQRSQETPEARAERLSKRRNSEWQRFMNRISLMSEEEKAKALAALQDGHPTDTKKGVIKDTEKGVRKTKKKDAKGTGVSVSLKAKDIMGGDDEASVASAAPDDSVPDNGAPSLQALVNAATACC